MSEKVIFLLAAGYGTRLRPFSHFLPKPLFPVHGSPLLLRNIDLLAPLQIPIYINCAYHPNALFASVGSHRKSPISFLYEVEPSGVLASLETLSTLIGPNTLICLLSSDLYLCDWQRLKKVLQSDKPCVFVTEDDDYAGACYLHSGDLLKGTFASFKEFFIFMKENYQQETFCLESIHIGQ